MDFAILKVDGLLFLVRWLHVFFGVVWIGMLYYFNFVQGAFFAETDATTKSNAIQKLLPRALWWFRWGAMGTFLMGLVMLAYYGQQLGPDFMKQPYGIAIMTGSTLGILMFLNVWLVIWPKQQIVIQSATQAATGGAALPTAAAAGARALVASRTNTLFSMPMLFFMLGARHLSFAISPTANLGILALVLAIIIGALELNALKGKTGPLTTVKGVVHCSIALTVVLYGVVEVLTNIG
jgi:uncharacterized membrane protein